MCISKPAIYRIVAGNMSFLYVLNDDNLLTKSIVSRCNELQFKGCIVLTKQAIFSISIFSNGVCRYTIDSKDAPCCTHGKYNTECNILQCACFDFLHPSNTQHHL